MLTISQLARKFELSRSTLLYYDQIGLLQPSARSAANYRLYDEEDVERLELICLYRKVGLSTEEIAGVLAADESRLRDALSSRLRALDEEIAAAREQQALVASLLRNEDVLEQPGPLTKRRWVEILRASGMDDEDMHRWHVEFERRSPEGHREFLVRLGIPGREVARIRARARE